MTKQKITIHAPKQFVRPAHQFTKITFDGGKMVEAVVPESPVPNLQATQQHRFHAPEVLEPKITPQPTTPVFKLDASVLFRK